MENSRRQIPRTRDRFHETDGPSFIPITGKIYIHTRNSSDQNYSQQDQNANIKSPSGHYDQSPRSIPRAISSSYSEWICVHLGLAGYESRNEDPSGRNNRRSYCKSDNTPSNLAGTLLRK